MSDEDRPSDERDSRLPVPQERLDAVISDLPQPKQQEIRHTVQEVFMALVERSSGPRIDPEVAKIIVASTDKDNEFKFQYLCQKQKDEADENRRMHEMATIQHKDRKQMLWPILITVLVVVLGSIASGIYLAATGHEVLGASLLTGILSAVFAYLAGLGTANFFKNDD